MSPLDLTGIEAEEAWGSAAVLPPGRHLCRITEAREGQSSGGYSQLELRLEAIDGPQAGFSIGDKQVVTPGSLGKVRQILEAAGVDVSEGMGAFEPHTLLGRRVVVFVGQEPGMSDPSKMYSVVQSYTATSESSNGDAAVQSTKADDDIPF